MPSLTPGANAPLPRADTFTLRLATGRAHADLVVLCVDADGRADGENGVALWTQPRCADGAVRIDTATDTAVVNVAALPADIVRLLVVAQADGVADMAACGPLSAEVAADGAGAAQLAVTAPPAMPTVQVGEFYRHRSGWKIRCLGDGYQDGLARLLQVHGIDVDDDPQAAPAAAPAPAAGQAAAARPPIALTKGEEKLPVDMRKRLSLRKEAVRVTLEKKGLGGVRARVILVMDASGSMASLYLEGTMAAVVERMMAVAAQLDDDGEMEAWTFATECAQLPSLQLGEMPAWIPANVRLGGGDASSLFAGSSGPSSGGLFKRRKKEQAAPAVTDGAVDWDRIGWGNEEQKVIADVTGFVTRNPVPDPTLVLFFSDGGVYNDDEIERALRKAVRAPIFWQFIGLGSSNGYGVLERFDTLAGREVDNVGFFAVDDVDGVGDAELYDRLLSEFPQWLADARKAGILR
jgi:stress response protein SCP2